MGGSGTLRLEGHASALSGAFDAVIAATTRGLKVGQPEADRLMAGDATLTASILRDEIGTHLRAMDSRRRLGQGLGLGRIVVAD